MENINSIIAFIGGSSVVASLLIQWLKGYIKKVIIPRWGDVGVLAILLVISGIISGISYAWQWIPMNITLAIVAIFTGAIVIYQVLYKAIIQKLILNRLDKDDK